MHRHWVSESAKKWLLIELDIHWYSLTEWLRSPWTTWFCWLTVSHQVDTDNVSPEAEQAEWPFLVWSPGIMYHHVDSVREEWPSPLLRMKCNPIQQHILVSSVNTSPVTIVHLGMNDVCLTKLMLIRCAFCLHHRETLPFGSTPAQLNARVTVLLSRQAATTIFSVVSRKYLVEPQSAFSSVVSFCSGQSSRWFIRMVPVAQILICARCVNKEIDIK